MIFHGVLRYSSKLTHILQSFRPSFGDSAMFCLTLLKIHTNQKYFKLRERDKTIYQVDNFDIVIVGVT